MHLGVFGGTFDPPHIGHLIIAQEALHNVATHATATGCRLALRFGDGEVVLEVSDDGVGFHGRVESVEGHGLANLAVEVADDAVVKVIRVLLNSLCPWKMI